MPAPARLDERDPFADTGRLAAIRDTCTIAGVPHFALGFFESGVTDAEATRHLAVIFGVRPKPPPFPGLLYDPAPRADD